MNAAFFMGSTAILGLFGGGGSPVCAMPTLSPDSGITSTSVLVSAAQAGAYIFYKKSPAGSLPEHSGSTASSGTSRIGTGSGNPSGTVSVGSGNFLVAITYQDGYADSNERQGYYGPNTPEP